MTIPPQEILAKARVKTQVKGKAHTWTFVEPEQPQPSETASTVSYPSQDPSVVGELSCTSSVDPWILGVTINSVSSVRRQAGAEYLLLDSGAQLHACPISYPRQKIPLPDPGIHTASGARLQHDGGRLVTYKLREKNEQFECLSTRVQFRNQFCLLAVSLSRGTGVIIVQTLDTLFVPDKTQTIRSHTQFVLCHKDDGRALDDSWRE